jgi:ketosteroid isomerase-like protein
MQPGSGKRTLTTVARPLSTGADPKRGKAMSSHGDLVRSFYDGMAAGDFSVMRIFAEDVEFRMPENLPHGGTIHGRDALGAYFGEVQGRWEGFRVELDDLVDADARVVALGRFCGTPRASGRYVEIPYALVWTMSNGEAVAVDEYTDTAMLIEALASQG